MNKLENNELIIETNDSGAELTRIYSKNLDKEILWNGNSKYWSRHSPILFPVVGRLMNNKTYIENKEYNMNQHGFARDMKFTVENVSNTSITYKLSSNDKTKKLYPYEFELTIIYTIINSSVKIEWIVENKDIKEIYFSIGAHPAFNILNDVDSLSDYYLEFKCKDKVNKISLNGPYYEDISYVDNLSILKINPQIFKNDALIYTNIDEINLKSINNCDYINVNFKDFPLVGIWSPYYKETNSIAPFICIEPWYGLSDSVQSDNIYMNKAYINKLEINQIFKTSYSINIEKE